MSASRRIQATWVIGGMLSLAAAGPCAADIYDDAVAHVGRPAADLKRDPLDQPAQMLRLAGIKPGMHVADILAGNGYYSEILSYIVGPGGKVLLINNPPYDKWSPSLEPRLAKKRLPNVEHLTVDLNHMGLARDSLDAVLLIKVYHDLYWVDDKQWVAIDPQAVLTQLAQALRPSGIVLLIDHSAKTGTGKGDAPRLHRIDEQFAIKDFEAHGFKVIAKSDALRRPDDARDHLTYQGPMVGKTDRFVLILRKSE